MASIARGGEGGVLTSSLLCHSGSGTEERGAANLEWRREEVREGAPPDPMVREGPPADPAATSLLRRCRTLPDGPLPPDSGPVPTGGREAHVGVRSEGERGA